MLFIRFQIAEINFTSYSNISNVALLFADQNVKGIQSGSEFQVTHIVRSCSRWSYKTAGEVQVDLVMMNMLLFTYAH